MKCDPLGNIIEYDDASDLKIALTVKCVCGHRAEEHKHDTDYYSYLRVSECLSCENVNDAPSCLQFEARDVCDECNEANPNELERIVLCIDCNPRNY